MIPEVLKNLLSSSSSNNDMADPSYDMGRVSTNNLQIKGSVHAAGEAYLTIHNLHGHLSKTDEYDDFNVRGSVHKTGTEDTTIESNSVVDISDLDIEKTDNGAERGQSRQSIKRNEHVHIETLVLFTGNSNVDYRNLDRTFVHFDELQITGDVHDTGVIEVEIDHLYVF